MRTRKNEFGGRQPRTLNWWAAGSTHIGEGKEELWV